MLVAGCDVSVSTAAATPSASSASESTLAPTATPGIGPISGCRSVDGLPDPACTPGAANTRDVTQATIGTTICVSGYTSSGQRSDGRSVRPPVSYTDALKLQGIAAYGYTDKNPSDYEEDHLLPLELGGDGYATRNLWPEPRYGQHPAASKDALENEMRSLVCSGTVSLAAAQRAIATDWETAMEVVTGSTPAPPVASPTSTSPSSMTVTITTSVYGAVSASTSPGASCTAKAKLPSGSYSQAQGLQIASVADSTGFVAWSYGTSASTHKGTGTHFVTCVLGGQSSTASAPFTV